MEDHRILSTCRALSAGHRASSGPFPALFASSGHTFPFVISFAARLSRWHLWRWPQFIDQPHRIFSNRLLGTATSAIWKVTWRACVTILAPGAQMVTLMLRTGVHMENVG